MTEEELKQFRIAKLTIDKSEENQRTTYSLEHGIFFSIFSTDCVSEICFSGVGNGYFSDVTGFITKCCISIPHEEQPKLYLNIELNNTFEKHEISDISRSVDSYLEHINQQHFTQFFEQEKNKFDLEFKKLLSYFDNVIQDKMLSEYYSYYENVLNYFFDKKSVTLDDCSKELNFFDLVQTKLFIDNHIEYSTKIKMKNDLDSTLPINSIKAVSKKI